MFAWPPPETKTPLDVAVVPPVMSPDVMFKVPEAEIIIASADAIVPALAFPTKFATAGAAAEKVTQADAADPAIAFAVSVIPLFNVNVPPAVAPPRVSLRT
jgi:hypothetical protein